MKVLITGGAGFIGSNIADAYLREGHDVVIVDDLSTGRRANIPSAARFYEASIAGDAMRGIIEAERPDVVNHHAAQIDVRKSVADPCNDLRINILGSVRLFEHCRAFGVRRIIFASTGGAIYGAQDVYPADESHRTDPCSPYGIAKLSVEKYLAFYRLTYGIETVALRYANVYGPRQNPHGEAGVIAIFARKLLEGQSPTIFGDGTQTRDYVFVQDVVQCNVRALAEGVSGVFNVGTGIETDLNALARRLMALAKTDCAMYYAPARAGEQQRSCLQPGALQAQPHTALRDGLRETYAWFRSVILQKFAG